MFCNVLHQRYTEVPQTPLCSLQILREEQDQWPEVQKEMTQALETMRIDFDPSIQLKGLDATKNRLLEKRKNRSGTNMNVAPAGTSKITN